MMGSTPTQYTVTSIPPAAVRWRGSSPFGDPLGTPSPDYSPRPCGGAFAITIHTFAVFGLYGSREAWCVCHTLRPVTTALRRVLHRPRLYLIDRVREVQYLRLEGVVRAGRSFVSRGPFEIRINQGKFLQE